MGFDNPKDLEETVKSAEKYNEMENAMDKDAMEQKTKETPEAEQLNDLTDKEIEGAVEELGK